jgi:RNA polymerase sigma-70 factor (ECF subfamily)
LRFISRKIGDAQDTEEIAQDTLFAFLERARDFTGSCKLSTYICSIAHNKIVDFYRKRKLKKIVFSQLPTGFETLVSQTVSPEEAVINQFVKQKIKEGLF